MPGGTSRPYSAKPRCRLLNFSLLAGSKGRQAGCNNVALIVSTVLFRLLPAFQKQKARSSFSPGFALELLANDDRGLFLRSPGVRLYAGDVGLGIPRKAGTERARRLDRHGFQGGFHGNRIHSRARLDEANAAMQQSHRQAAHGRFVHVAACSYTSASLPCGDARACAKARRNSRRVGAVATCKPCVIVGAIPRSHGGSERSSPP